MENYEIREIHFEFDLNEIFRCKTAICLPKAVEFDFQNSEIHPNWLKEIELIIKWRWK